MTTIPDRRPEANIEVRVSIEGCYAKARAEGAPDRIAREFVGVFASRTEAITEATGWALGWLRKLRSEEARAV